MIIIVKHYLLNKNIKEVIQTHALSILYNLFIFSFLCATINLKLTKVNDSGDDYVFTQNFVSQNKAIIPAYYIYQAIFLESLLLLFVTIKFLIFLSHNNKLNMVLNALVYCLFHIFYYSLYLIFFIIMMSFIFTNVYGDDGKRFYSFTRSFSQVISILIGNINLYDEVIIKPVWTIIIVILIVIFNMILTSSIFIALFVENFRRFGNINNYSLKKQVKWVLKDYIKWIFKPDLGYHKEE